MASTSFAYRCALRVAAGSLALGIGLASGAVLSAGAASAKAAGSAPSTVCGAVLVAKTSWLGGNGVDVRSNGTSEGSSSDCSSKSSLVNGVLAGRRWQCTELINRLYLTRGWITTTWLGDAGQPFWDNTPAGLVKQTNGSVSYLRAGDVVDANEYHSGAFVSGHVFAVSTPRQVTVGAVSLLSQNNSGLAKMPAVLLKGTVSIPGGAGWSYRIVGVIHAP